MISISISYKFVSDAMWQSFDLSEAAYFDIDSADSEPLDVESIPKYDDVLDYLFIRIGDDANKVTSAKIVITDSITDAKVELLTTYWNDQRNRIVESVVFGSRNYYELIISSEISEFPCETEITRLIRKEGVLVPVYHGFIKDNPDGSQSERKVDL